MEQIEVEILAQTITATHGTLQQGAILRTDAAFAKHLVDDCGAAKYVKAKTAPAKAEPKPASAANKPSAAKPTKVKGAPDPGAGKSEPGSDSDLALVDAGQVAQSVPTSAPEPGAALIDAPG